MEWVTTTAKTLPEAIDLALDNLGVDEAEAEIVVLEEPSKGLFGRMRGSARVEARVKPRVIRPKNDRGRGRRSRSNEGGRGRGGRGRSGDGRKRNNARNERSSGGKSSNRRGNTATDNKKSGGRSDGRSGNKSDNRPDGKSDTNSGNNGGRRQRGGGGEQGRRKDQAAAANTDRNRDRNSRGRDGSKDKAKDRGRADKGSGNGDRSKNVNADDNEVMALTGDGSTGSESGSKRNRGRGNRGRGSGADTATKASTSAAVSKNDNDNRSGESASQKKIPNKKVFEETPMEEVAEHLRTFLGGLTEAFGLEGGVAIDDSEPEVLVATVEGQHGLMVGPKGRTLDAIQELARVSSQRAAPSSIRIRVDVGGYRAQRVAALADFAAKAADKAVDNASEVALEPMSPADRKAVHDALSEDGRVETRSAGTEPRRRVIVIPAEDTASNSEEEE